MDNKNLCSVLLSSCDAYSDTWMPFFALMNRYWKDCPYDVYLNTESLSFNTPCDFGFEVTALHPKNPACRWGERMIDVLHQIDTPYIFLTLDDYFIKSELNQEVFNHCLELMEKDPSIASIQMDAARRVQEGKREIKDDKIILNELPKSGWKTHFIPTIWRKSVLLKWLRKHESIWGFELYGSQRAIWWHYKEKVLTLDAPVVYDYLWVDSCSVIAHGKWLESDKVDSFFADNGLEIDFSKRGRISFEEIKSGSLKDTIKKLSFSQFVERCFARVRSLW